MNSTQKFAVDTMLGKLAKWLRLIGYDTFYKNKIKPVTLQSIAQSEKRIIVTRNHYFLKHPFPVPIIFLHSDILEKQLLEINEKYPLQKNNAFSRCPICNRVTTPINKEYVKKLVPKYVFSTQEYFHQCIHCGKIYWRGTHLERALAFLEKMVL